MLRGVWGDELTPNKKQKQQESELRKAPGLHGRCWQETEWGEHRKLLYGGLGEGKEEIESG